MALTKEFPTVLNHLTPALAFRQCPKKFAFQLVKKRSVKIGLMKSHLKEWLSTVNPGARAGTEYSKVSPLRLK
jgi:hypothetical protein